MSGRTWALDSTIRNARCLSRWLDREECTVRVKVPIYAKRQHHRGSSCVSPGNFYIKKNDEGHYELDKEHSYWHQVQGQLHLTERDLCYFVVWTTKETLVLQINKDPAWADNLRRLQDFYTRHIIPAFITDLL